MCGTAVTLVMNGVFLVQVWCTCFHGPVHWSVLGEMEHVFVRGPLAVPGAVCVTLNSSPFSRLGLAFLLSNMSVYVVIMGVVIILLVQVSLFCHGFCDSPDECWFCHPCLQCCAICSHRCIGMRPEWQYSPSTIVQVPGLYEYQQASLCLHHRLHPASWSLSLQACNGPCWHRMHTSTHTRVELRSLCMIWVAFGGTQTYTQHTICALCPSTRMRVLLASAD